MASDDFVDEATALGDPSDRRDPDQKDTLPDYRGKTANDNEGHATALDRLQIAVEAVYKQVNREKQDLRYQVPELMWSEDAKSWRAGEDLGGGIIMPDRPMVAIPVVEAAVRLVLNEERAAQLGVTVHPESEDADEETAKMLTGLYRQIDRESRAGLARSWGFNRAVKVGRGAWIVLTEPAYDYRRTGDQNIRIKRLLYQEAFYPDPFALEPDQSDGGWGFLLEWVPWSRYQRLYKKKSRYNYTSGRAEEMPSLLATYSDGDLVKLQDECPEWIRGEGESRAVLIAQYFEVEQRPDSRRESRQYRWREREDRRVRSRWMNAVEFMNEDVIHSAYIPVVPCIGEELIPFDGERRWQGMYRPNKDAQNVFNYAGSNAVEAMAQEPRNTWVMAEGQEIGHEREFVQANIKNFPYVRYKPTTVGDQMVPPPSRTQVDSSKLGMSMEMLSMASEWIQKGTSFFDPSLGRQNPNAKTKGGTLALQRQGDQSNSHWLDSQAELSMTYEAKVVLSMIPYYYDRPGRIVRVLGLDDQVAKQVMLNRPYRMQGTRPMAAPWGTREEKAATMAAVADPTDPTKLHNLRTGLYGLVVSIGKGYRSRLDQGADELGQLFQAEPQLFTLLGDIYLRFRDFPGHEEAAERIKRMIPPQALGQQDDQQGGDPKAQLEQAKQALAMMQQKLQELQPERMKYDAQMKMAAMEADVKKALKQADVQLQQMKDATSIAVAEIAAKSKLATAGLQGDLESIALGQQHAFDATEGAKDRAADVATAAAGASVASQSADADQQRALELAQAQGDQTRQTQAAGSPPAPDASPQEPA